MEFDCPLIEEPATPEYVLGVLADFYRHEAPYMPPLSFDTTVDEWELTMFFEGWREIAHSMNGFWGINIPLEEWRKVLLPMDKHTVREICDLVAHSAKRPRLLPLPWLGRECMPASAFLAIRWLLHRAGCDVSNVAPSTRLSDFDGHYHMRLREEIVRLVPRMLPLLQVGTPGVDIAMCLSLLGAVAAVIGLGFSVILAILGAATALASVAFLALAVLGIVPMSVSFGDFRTFRDLAVAVAERQRTAASIVVLKPI
jgi:hypothetical protein